jgi:hypothetical protein
MSVLRALADALLGEPVSHARTQPHAPGKSATRDVLLEEYRALRAEILLTLERRVTILSYGLTAIGVLTAAGIAALSGSRPSEPAATTVFLLAIPATATFVLEIWFAETHRGRRASHFLQGIEVAVNAELPGGKRGLTWEHEIRAPNPAAPQRLFTTHYGRIILYFSLAAAASLFAGLLLLQGRVLSGSEVASFEYRVLALALAVAFGAWRVLSGRSRAEWLEQNYNQGPDALDLPRPNIGPALSQWLLGTSVTALLLILLARGAQ